MKIKTISAIAALMLTGSVYAASGDVVGTQDVTINGSIVNSTCNVSFPNDYTFAPINLSAGKVPKFKMRLTHKKLVTLHYPDALHQLSLTIR